MAFNRTNIHKALAGYLNTNFSSSSNVIWENVKKDLIEGQIYVSEDYMPNDTNQITLGSSGEFRDFGLYQLTIYVPVGTSTITADTYIEELSNLYKPGTYITKSGVSVFIEKSTPAQGFQQDNWYMIPLTISWTCDLPIN